MKREFIKKTMVAAITRKATAALPILRGEEITEKGLDELMREYDRRDGSLLKMMAEADQDPNEIKEIFLEALEEVFVKLKERALKNVEIVFKEVSRKVTGYKRNQA